MLMRFDLSSSNQLFLASRLLNFAAVMGLDLSIACTITHSTVTGCSTLRSSMYPFQLIAKPGGEVKVMVSDDATGEETVLHFTSEETKVRL